MLISLFDASGDGVAEMLRDFLVCLGVADLEVEQQSLN